MPTFWSTRSAETDSGTPTTLIALLRTVAFSWRQEALSRDMATVQQLGKELYTRLGKVAEHLDNLGVNLGKAVAAFNATVGSVESRVMVTARPTTITASRRSGAPGNPAHRDPTAGRRVRRRRGSHLRSSCCGAYGGDVQLVSLWLLPTCATPGARAATFDRALGPGIPAWSAISCSPRVRRVSGS